MKVPQSCLTLCDPMDYTVHGTLQARILEWVAFPFPGIFPTQGIELKSPALQADSLPAEPQEKPHNQINNILSPHIVTIVCVLRTLKIYSVSKFQESNIVLLTIVIMLFIRSVKLSLQNWNFFLLTNITLFLIPPCPPPPTTTILLSAFPSLAFFKKLFLATLHRMWDFSSLICN